jgi:hypothetical protein
MPEAEQRWHAVSIVNLCLSHIQRACLTTAALEEAAGVAMFSRGCSDSWKLYFLNQIKNAIFIIRNSKNVGNSAVFPKNVLLQNGPANPPHRQDFAMYSIQLCPYNSLRCNSLIGNLLTDNSLTGNSLKCNSLKTQLANRTIRQSDNSLLGQFAKSQFAKSQLANTVGQLAN